MDYFFIPASAYQKIQEQELTVSRKLEILSCYNRINTLSTISHTGRGWIGACFSIAELLTSLYYKFKDDTILLSKGHAAVMQYACLAGIGILPEEELLKYKMPDGPQAHTDIKTPGIEVNSGSLGQGLSKGTGMALTDKRQVWVIMGDGELQEGQNFEALMTIKQYNLTNIVPIIDCNMIQSDSNVSDIKGITNLQMVLEGFGFKVLKVKGNDAGACLETLKQAQAEPVPCVIIAETSKAAGISFMSSNNTERRNFDWHGKAPNYQEYGMAIMELVKQLPAESQERELISTYCKSMDFTVTTSKASKAKPLSTGDAYGKDLVQLAKENSDIVALDADLEKSCRLSEFAKELPDQFYEIGISEQDMASIAGGMALRGKRPFVNTYSSFLRRCFEQVYVNASESTPVVYAGHYSGLCYTTDGKTHQCTGDIAMMRSIPGMKVYYPAFPEQLPVVLKESLNNDGPSYIRLHRTPLSSELPLALPKNINTPVCLNKGEKSCFITTGPHMADYCLKAAKQLNMSVYVITDLSDIAVEALKDITSTYSNIFIAEETFENGGLFDFIADKISALNLDTTPALHHKACNGFTYSSLVPNELYNHFELTDQHLITWVNKTL